VFHDNTSIFHLEEERIKLGFFLSFWFQLTNTGAITKWHVFILIALSAGACRIAPAQLFYIIIIYHIDNFFLTITKEWLICV